MGGGGFIGSHLSEALLTAKYNVTVLDQPGAYYIDFLRSKGARIQIGSYLDPEILKKSLIGIDTVFHLVSTTVPKTSNSDPVFDIQSNLIGTVNLLSIAKENGVKKIIFASSGGTVYGIPKEIPISESHPTDPISSYGIVKLAIEKYAHLYWTLHNVDYRVLRISNAYGERQSPNGVQGIIPTIISSGLQNKEIQIWGDGSVIRDYIFISDIVDAFLKVSIDSSGLKIFNVGSGMGVSINDLVIIISKLLDKRLNVVFQYGLAYDVPINILDNSRSREILEWNPKVDIKEGIDRTVNFLKNSKLEKEF